VLIDDGKIEAPAGLNLAKRVEGVRLTGNFPAKSAKHMGKQRADRRIVIDDQDGSSCHNLGVIPGSQRLVRVSAVPKRGVPFCPRYFIRAHYDHRVSCTRNCRIIKTFC
jgi:hypothetical protein